MYSWAATLKSLGEDGDQPSSWILSLVLSRRLTDLVFTAAAGVSIASAAYIGSGSDTSRQLGKVAIILYLYITIAVSFQAAFLVYKERKALSESLSSVVLLHNRPCTTRIGADRTPTGWGVQRSLRALFDFISSPDPTSVPPRDV